MTTLEKMLHFVQAHQMLPAGSRVLCAVSGGADSVALLGALFLLRDKLALGGLAVAHFNHKLRGAQADRDQAFVRTLCGARDIQLFVGQADVAAEAARRSANLEDTARSLRYAFLNDTADRENFSRIATGHTADDNVETVLMHLVRGAGLSGLLGIPPVRGRIIRPLLGCTRRDVEAFLAENGFPHVEDATNSDVALSRNRLRHLVIPQLRALNPSFSDSVLRLTENLRQDEDFLRERAEEAMQTAERTAEDGITIPAPFLAAMPRSISSRLCRLLYASVANNPDASLSRTHIESILALCENRCPSASVSLPQGITAHRCYDSLSLGVNPPAPPPTSSSTSSSASEPVTILVPGKTYDIERAPGRISVSLCPSATVSDEHTFHLACHKIQGRLVLRARLPGDRLRLPGKPGSRSLKRLMIDAKIPAALRESWPVVADDKGVAAVIGLGVDASRLASPGETSIQVSYFLESK